VPKAAQYGWIDANQIPQIPFHFYHIYILYISMHLLLQGGYWAAKKQKLDGQFNASDGPNSRIFDGVAVYVDGYTSKSKKECFLLKMNICPWGCKASQLLYTTLCG
jgi:hypothetical protein